MQTVVLKFDNLKGESIMIGDSHFDLRTDKHATEIAGGTVFSLDYVTATRTLTITKDGGGAIPPEDISRLLDPDNAEVLKPRGRF